MSKVQLVLVGAQRYTYMPFRIDPIMQGETIEVDEPIAEKLQSLFVVDAAHGKREVFVSPDHPRALQFAENQEAMGRPAAKKAAPRRKSVAKKKAVRSRTKTA